MARRMKPSHRVDILRRSDNPDDANVTVSPTGALIAAANESRREPVAEDVPFAFNTSSTSWIREETGERVRRPAQGFVMSDVEIREGDILELEDADGNDDGRVFVEGVDPTYDRRRERIISTTVELSETE